MIRPHSYVKSYGGVDAEHKFDFYRLECATDLGLLQSFPAQLGRGLLIGRL